MDANKKICLDEVSVRFLRSLKSERQKMGLTQEEMAQLIGSAKTSIGEYERCTRLPSLRWLIKLSEVFGYDLSSSVNYKYWHGEIDFMKLREQYAYYGFTCHELSGYVGYDETAVYRVFWHIRYFSLECLNAILGIFEDERRLLSFRNELLSRKTPSRREWWKRTKAPAMHNSGSRKSY